MVCWSVWCWGIVWCLLGLFMWVLLVFSVVGGVVRFMLVHFSLDFSVGCYIGASLGLDNCFV